MKFSKFLLLCFTLIFSFTYCEDKRKLLAEKIKKYLLSLDKINGAKELIKSFDVTTMILCNTLALNEIKEMQIKFGLPDSVTDQLKSAKYVSENNIKIIEEENPIYGSFEGEETIGAAFKEDNGKISFAIIKATSSAKIKYLYEKICTTFLAYFKQCKNEIRQLTENEKILIKKAIKSSIINSLLKATEILKRDDYELYMTAPGSIFSPDKKSVAHVTYFGDIAIGPSNELNSVLPLDLRLKLVKTNDKKGYYQNIGNYTEFVGYPKTNKVSQKNILTLNNGLFHEFNFIVNDKISRFTR